MTHGLSFPVDRWEIRVACYAGYRGEETPRQLTMGTHRIDVVAIRDRWLAPDHRYFKLIGDDGGLYIIRHDPHQDIWQLTYFQANASTRSIDGTRDLRRWRSADANKLPTTDPKTAGEKCRPKMP